MATDTKKEVMKPLQARLNLRMVQQKNIRTVKLYQEQSTMRMDSPLLLNIKMKMDAITRKSNMTSLAIRLMRNFMNKPYIVYRNNEIY